MFRKLKAMAPFLLTSVILITCINRGSMESSRKDRKGPSIRNEPPSRVEFSNSSGTELRCEADGLPIPKLTWQTREGSRAIDVAGLRYQRGDGTLVFPPFERTDYRQDVHDTVYQCMATNEVGTILSREVHVRGVIKQRFSPQVYDDFVVKGNTAVLRCHLPTFVREHVTVDAWIRNDDHILKLSADTRARSYTVLKSGELLVHDVKERDSNKTYRCQTRHKLTGEMVVSVSAGKIIVTEPHVSTLPRVTFSRTQIRAEEGTESQLPCVAQGNPPPTYRWMKEVSGVLRPIKDVEEESPTARVWVNQGMLNIRKVQFSDGGQYQCIVRNSIGERRVETSFVVIAPLAVNVSPQHQVLSIGQEATFSCNVSGYPIHAVSWRRDKRPLMADTRVRLVSRDVLHISSVRRQDRGMYQCFAHNDRDSAQGAAELSIADVSPSIISAFVEQIAQPGERISLKCVSTGNPVPEVNWYLDGEPIVGLDPRIGASDYVTEHGHVVGHLNISDVRVEDGGEYQCQVRNEVGETSHSARLNVHGPPFVRQMPNMTAISGKDLNVRCPFGGHPVKGIRWFKSGMILPLNHRQKVSHAGTLTIQGVQRAADQGQYSCTVRNSDGTLTASGAVFISVVVSPVIDDHFFRESVTVDEGARAKLMCVVTRGDPPLTFRWLKDNRPFLAHGDTTVQTFEDTSIVTFKKVSSGDRGKYMCLAANAAESTNMTTQVVVNVPPQWIVEPINSSAVLGHTVWMDCAAVGFPSPNILWKKLIFTDNAAGDFTYVHSSPRAHRYNNGTLVLSEVEEGDSGSYLCQANNGIGAGLSKIVELKILVPPRFDEPYQSQTVAEGTNTSLKCVASGDPPIDLSWQKNKEHLDAKRNYRYTFHRSFEMQESVSELRIWNVNRNDTGMFTCMAKSNYGSDDSVIQLIVQGIPDSPTNISITNVSSRSVSLQWEVSHNGNSHITGSVVQYKTTYDNIWTRQTSQLIVSGADTGATLRALTPVTTYIVRVIAENFLGKSTPSESINVTTEEEAPSGAPRDVQVHSTGAQSMKVSWKSPPEDTHNGYIRGYHVGYRPTGSSEPYHFKKIDRVPESDQQQTQFTYITGLKPFTKYDIVVKAFNSAGNGPKSSKTVGKTLETAPPTSPLFQVESTSTTSMDITWQKDVKDKSAITEYMLHYKTDDGEWRQERLSSSQNHFTLSGLNCGTKYNLYMTASNSLGTGEPSVPIIKRTMGAAPMSPSASTFLVPNSTSVTLKLNKWQSKGCTIQHFVVQHRPKHQHQWVTASERLKAPLDQFVLRHLLPDREYVVMVTAYSEAGMTKAEYQFRTMPAAASSVVTSSPAYGKRETDQPFYKNVALLIPIVVSCLVLAIVIFSVVVCLRKHSTNQRCRLEYENRKSCSQSLMMSDLTKHTGSQSSTKSSHYAIPSGKGPDYAEPYTCNLSPRQSSDGLFATIKRYPTRPIYLSTSYKQGSEVPSQPTPALESDTTSEHNTTGKWSGHPNSSQKPQR